MARRRRRSLERKQRGFVLIALIALLVMAGLYFLVSNLTPELVRARRQQQTDEALAQARDALIGYAVRFREEQLKTGTSGMVYGFLPLPDLGSSRNNNAGCTDEGCDAANFADNAPNATVIGRFPWRALGTGPLRDGHGECLWYVVSGSHQRIQQSSPMNWDTLGQTDIVVASGSAAMASAIASAHDRPIAVIFAAGPPLAGQDRSPSAIAPADVVTECGGNYDPRNYLDPADTSLLGGPANFIPAADRLLPDKPWLDRTMSVTAATNKAFSIVGAVIRRSDGTLWNGSCSEQGGLTCTEVANDRGLAVTSDALFRVLRGSGYFRSDIDSMLDRMADCLRDQIAASGTLAPVAMTGVTPPAGKAVGRLPAGTCYDDTQNPKGYFSHYQNQLFVLKPDTGNLDVAVDGGAPQSCAAALVFAGQRGLKSPAPTDAGESAEQRRDTAEVSVGNPVQNRDWPASYLEDDNLAAFTTTATSLAGPRAFGVVKANRRNVADVTRCLSAGKWTVSADCHSMEQDIVRCIPAGASLSVVAPTVAAASGNLQLASYAPATGVLTLGSVDQSSNYGALPEQLYACAWTPEAHAAGSGLRSYFRFRIRRVGDGFTIALIDGDRNGANVCGAARQHLGYSGDNGNLATPYIQWPKLAVEFDTSRNCNATTYDASGRPACTFTESGSTLSNGRNDPCYTTSCWAGSPLYPGTSQGLDNSSHVAIVYWGYGASLGQPLQDDNVHDQTGLPMPTDSSARPGPRNPAPVLPYVANPAVIPGIAPLDRMGNTDAAKREFHARVELSRSFTAPADPRNGATTVQLQLWIEAQPAASISAMTYNAGSPPTLGVTATAHGLATGDKVVIKDAVPAGYNGEYTVTVGDADHFTATLPAGTANPGPYISAIAWTNVSGFADQAIVTSANHGLATGDSITIAGAVPTIYNGVHAVTRIDASTYQFDLELDYQPGTMAPAVATPKALTPRATALADTTRPMSTLDATAKPLVSDTATIYDEQMSACAASAPLCPNGQSCGSDNMCYRPSLRNLRLGFTAAERVTTSTTTARGQLIEIRDRSTTWLP